MSLLAVLRPAVSLLSLTLVACASLQGAKNASFPESPYPQSRYIKGVTWDFSATRAQRRAHGSDLWPCTWASDWNLYCAWGDGGGFDGDDDNIGRVSLGFARIQGIPTPVDPGGFDGRNVWGAAPDYAEHAATFGGKVWTMICVDGTLYAYGHLWTAKDTPNPVGRGAEGPVHTLIWSDDLGASWHLAPWSSDQLGTFLNYGPDNAGAVDGFVYIYYHRPNDHNRVYLKRITGAGLKANPSTSHNYQYLTGVTWRGGARSWSASERDAAVVFFDPRGADIEVVYDAPLGRYLLTAAHNPGQTLATASAGQIGLFESLHPWGPWATIGYYDDWGNLGPQSHGDNLGLVLPTKWFGADGRTLWAIFSSLGEYDSFYLVEGTLEVMKAH